MTVQASLSKPLTMACQIMRWVALIWLMWALARMTAIWFDGDQVVRNYSRLAGYPLPPMSTVQHIVSYIIILVDWSVSALIVARIWQLVGHYMRGDIFTAASVATLSSLGCAGLAATAVDLAARPLIFAVVSGGGLRMWLEPNDLLHIMMAVFIVVVAKVFETGVALADDSRQIV